MAICLRGYDGRFAIELPPLRARVVSRTSRAVSPDRLETPIHHRLGLVWTLNDSRCLRGALPLIISWSLVRVQQGPLHAGDDAVTICDRATSRPTRGPKPPLASSCHRAALTRSREVPRRRSSCPRRKRKPGARVALVLPASLRDSGSLSWRATAEKRPRGGQPGRQQPGRRPRHRRDPAASRRLHADPPSRPGRRSEP